MAEVELLATSRDVARRSVDDRDASMLLVFKDD